MIQFPLSYGVRTSPLDWPARFIAPWPEIQKNALRMLEDCERRWSAFVNDVVGVNTRKGFRTRFGKVGEFPRMELSVPGQSRFHKEPFVQLRLGLNVRELHGEFLVLREDDDLDEHIKAVELPVIVE